MAKLFNMSRVLGVTLVPDGTLMYNGRPVIGIRDAGNALFLDNQRVIQCDVISDGSTLYNDQPVVGAVLIADARAMYNNQLVIPVTGAVRPDPISILGSDLLAWFTADDPAFLGISGGTVYTWRDKAVTRTLSQSTAGNRPLFSATSFNGSPGLTFDGTDDFIGSISINHGLPLGNIEQWALVDQTQAPNSNPYLITCYGGNGGTSGRRSIDKYNSPLSNILAMRSPNSSKNEAIFAAGNNIDFTGRHAIRGVHTGTALFLQMDGGEPQSFGFTAGPAGTNGLTIGSSNTPSAFFKGVVRDIIYCNILTPEKRDALWAWLLPRRNP